MIARGGWRLPHILRRRALTARRDAGSRRLGPPTRRRRRVRARFRTARARSQRAWCTVLKLAFSLGEEKAGASRCVRLVASYRGRLRPEPSTFDSGTTQLLAPPSRRLGGVRVTHPREDLSPHRRKGKDLWRAVRLHAGGHADVPAPSHVRHLARQRHCAGLAPVMTTRTLTMTKPIHVKTIVSLASLAPGHGSPACHRPGASAVIK
jgi:hypothetical protein